ncbi:response regulator transcription factor [Dictyobacter arantiisoli]|uniref:Response regulatory domain-containing protein n=1 Tax=Dictyobacter arantiisoli TaxID=2014874 RepID=A0A5A5TJL8_9CHLR|nr:response regulator [Dictyobacter arantiisoli]GCF11627.1 hypothetical protein KDI_51910 [Dictyobacter arantiisoli]
MHDNSAANALTENGDKNTLEHSLEIPVDAPRFSNLGQAVANQEHGGLHHQQHILVVEDDPTLATLEADILTAHGYHVVAVASGELALATLHHTIPDLVVLDLELPGEIHGWDVLQTLRAQASIPVLITSSSVTNARKYLRNRGESRQMLDHLSKPYSLQALLKRITRMLPHLPSQ